MGRGAESGETKPFRFALSPWIYDVDSRLRHLQNDGFSFLLSQVFPEIQVPLCILSLGNSSKACETTLGESSNYGRISPQLPQAQDAQSLQNAFLSG